MATATFSPHVSRPEGILNRILVTGIALFVVILFLAPLGYVFTTAVKSDSQMSDQCAGYWPHSPMTITHEGRRSRFSSFMEDGEIRELGLV